MDKIKVAFLEHQMDMVDYPVKLNKSRAEHAKKIQEEVLPYAKANIKIANGIHQLRGKCNLYANLLIFALAALFGLITGDLSIAIVALIVAVYFGVYKSNKE